MSEVSTTVENAVARLVVKQTFFASILFDMLTIIEEDAPLGGQVTTAATDGRRLYICAPWFRKLTLDEQVFVLCHEVMHVILMHPQRVRGYKERGLGPDFKPINFKKFNKAADYVINPMLTGEKIGSMPHGGLYHPNYTSDDVVDEVYMKLPDEDDDEQFDDCVAAADDAATPDQMATTVAKAAQSGRAAGNLPTGMGRIIGEATEPQIRWADHIRMTLLATAGKDETSWAHVRRRRLAMSPHIPWPGTTGHVIGVCAMYEDTSGSISPEVLNYFRSEMSGMFSELTPEALYIGSCDTEATEPLLINDLEEIMTAPSVGGGGTNMGAIFPMLEKHDVHPEALVILTDGYTPWGERPDYPVVWVITEKSIEAPYGTSVYLDVTQAAAAS